MADEEVSFLDLEDDELGADEDDKVVVDDPDKEVDDKVDDPDKVVETDEDDPDKVVVDPVADTIKPQIDTNAAQIAGLQAEIEALKNKPEPVVEEELPEFIRPSMEEWAESPNDANEKIMDRAKLELRDEFDKKLNAQKQEQTGDAEFKKTHETAWSTVVQIDPELNVANSQKNQLANTIYKQMGLDKVAAGPLLAGAAASFFINQQSNQTTGDAPTEAEVAAQLEASRQERVKTGSVQTSKKSGIKAKTTQLTPDQEKTARRLGLNKKEMLDALKSDGQMEDK